MPTEPFLPEPDHSGHDHQLAPQIVRQASPESDAELQELADLLAERDGRESWNPILMGRASSGLRRHLDPARSNLLGILNIDRSMSVLEFGAETGALTRFLGEHAGSVKALEQDARRAMLAASRTRDLSNVSVVAGRIEDLSPVETFDVILAVDSLRDTDPAGRHALLEDLSARLAPGGSLVLAESNRIGTKFLLGSPDDRTGRVFDSIEGYPTGSSSQAMGPAEVSRLLEAAGLKHEFLLALPDHTFPRAIVRPSILPPELQMLSSDLSILPSPDLSGTRPKLADERHVWPLLVAEGLETALANSWVIVATTSETSDLLDERTLAAYFSWQRAAKYTHRTVIRTNDDGVWVDRVYPQRSDDSPLHVEDSVVQFAPGKSLLSVMEESDIDSLGQLLAVWRSTVEAFTSNKLWLDLDADNLIVLADGSIMPIDLEFASTKHELDYALRRGLLVTARALAVARPVDSWPAGTTRVRDVALWLGEQIGYTRASSWLEKALAEEAALQTEVTGERDVKTTEADRLNALHAQFDTPMENLPLGKRVFDVPDDLELSTQLAQALEARSLLSTQLAQALEARSLLSAHIDSIERELAAKDSMFSVRERHLQDQINQAQCEIESRDALLSSRAVRVALRSRRAAEWALPGGSYRRRLMAILMKRSTPRAR